MIEHTKGPWHVAPEGKAQSPWIVCDPEGGSIADCEPPGPWMPIEVASANARLIAAAPEMLDALKDYITECTDVAVSPTWPRLPEIRASMRAAIAKAEGRPSR